MRVDPNHRPSMVDAKATLAEVLLFCKRHRVHALLLPLAAIGITALHESAHALAAIVQGGQILELVVWPGDGEWGHVQYRFPPGVAYSSTAISLAPYVMWAGLMALVMLASLRGRPWPFWVASTLFVWGFAVAYGDIAYAWLGWLSGAPNDLGRTFGAAGPEMAAALAAVSLVVAVLGYFVQRRLYGGRALSPLACGVVSALTGAALLAVTALAW